MTEKIKLLLVDDDPDMIAVMAIRLTKAGYELYKATTGNEALKALNTFKPDVVLLDVHLPDLSGGEVQQKIHAQTEFQTLPIIFFSGTLDQGEMPSAPYTMALVKPCPFETIDSTIKKMIKGDS